METTELLEIVARGEDSRHQFKEDATNAISLGDGDRCFRKLGRWTNLYWCC